MRRFVHIHSLRYRSNVNSILQGSHVLVAFVTAGYPRIQDTVSILLAMQAGGADIIEVGMPFSDPIADGRAIQETNQVGTLIKTIL